MTWEQDSFAYADSYDEAEGRYRGLHHGPRGALSDSDPGLIVRPDVAGRQIESEVDPPDPPVPPEDGNGEQGEEGETPIEEDPPLKRYHGAVRLDSTRFGRDASDVANEVIAHLAGLLGADVELTLEIKANIPGGAPEQVVRTVTENSRALKFDDSGFETE